MPIIKAGRIRWLGHVARMGGYRVPKTMMDGRPGGRRLRCCPVPGGGMSHRWGGWVSDPGGGGHRTESSGELL